MYKTYFAYFPGNHDSTKRKKKNSTKLSEGIGNNPFLQSTTLPTIQDNPFLLSFYNNSRNQSVMSNVFLPQFYGNRSQPSVPNIFLPQENSSITIEIFINSNNPFLSSIGTQVPSVSPSSSPTSHQPPSPTPHEPSSPAPHQPPSSALNTPVPFTTNESTPVKVGSPVPTPSIIDLIGATRPRSEFSK